MANYLAYLLFSVLFIILFFAIKRIRRSYLIWYKTELVLTKLLAVLSRNEDEDIPKLICEGIFQVTGADEIVVMSYFPVFDTSQEIVCYYKQGKHISERTSTFVESIKAHKMDMASAYYIKGVRGSPVLANALETEYRFFLSWPIVSDKLGRVGAMIVAKREGLSPPAFFDELMNFFSSKILSITEQYIFTNVEHEKKRVLAKKLEIARENERHELARDLHDDLGGNLVALKIDISLINQNLEKRALAPEVLTMLNQATVLVDRCLQDTRKMVSSLRTGVLDDLGILEAIRWRLREIEINNGIKTRLNNTVELSDLGIENPSDRVSLFRLIAEALTNVIKHAKANKIDVDIKQRQDRLTVTISDNGIGIDPTLESKTDSFGLISMKERAELLDGTFSILPNRSGTRVLVEIPLKKVKSV